MIIFGLKRLIQLLLYIYTNKIFQFMRVIGASLIVLVTVFCVESIDDSVLDNFRVFDDVDVSEFRMVETLEVSKFTVLNV